MPGEFIDSLQSTTYMEWHPINWVSNQPFRNSLSEARRYLTYIFKPFSIVFRKDFENIIAWQQFYGICYCFWSRLLRRPKTARLTVMTFIYKPKDGYLGRLYESFIRYALTSRYVDTITCSSSAECNRYAQEFAVPEEKFRFVPWCIEDFSADYPFKPSGESGYVLAAGRSNRDYLFLIEAIRNTDFKVKVVDDTLGEVDESNNVEVIRDSGWEDTLRLLSNSWVEVIPIDKPDVSAGQTVLLEAWAFGKPVVCTRGEGLSDDYITDGVNGLLIDKDTAQLVAALERLRDDSALYARLAQNGRREYEENYTEKALGRHVGETFL